MVKRRDVAELKTGRRSACSQGSSGNSCSSGRSHRVRGRVPNVDQCRSALPIVCHCDAGVHRRKLGVFNSEVGRSVLSARCVIHASGGRQLFGLDVNHVPTWDTASGRCRDWRPIDESMSALRGRFTSTAPVEWDREQGSSASTRCARSARSGRSRRSLITFGVTDGAVNHHGVRGRCQVVPAA